MGTIRRFEDLKVWQLARELTNVIYAMTEVPRFRTDPDLRRDLRVTVRSVMDNIAEGFKMGSSRHFIHFLDISLGSLGEVMSKMHTCVDNAFVDAGTFVDVRNRCDHIEAKIKALIRYLRRRDKA